MGTHRWVLLAALLDDIQLRLKRFDHAAQRTDRLEPQSRVDGRRLFECRFEELAQQREARKPVDAGSSSNFVRPYILILELWGTRHGVAGRIHGRREHSERFCGFHYKDVEEA